MTRRERISTMFARRALTSPDAPLEHYVNGLEWGLPRALELSADHLAWDAHRDEDRVARPGPGLLQDFVKLADAPDAAILKYAARCGPLWLCDCGLPWQVNSPFYQCQVADVPGRPGWHSEWLSDWRDIARDAGAVLRIAHKLRNRQLAEPADWELVRGKGTRISGFGVMVPVREGPWEDDDWADYMKESRERARRGRQEPARPRGGATLEEQHRSFWNVMDGWVLRGGVRPFFEWGADDRVKPSIRLGGYSLYGAIAVQLLFDVARTDGLAICVSCGTPYLPTRRRPRWDENNYCLDCGRRAAARDASTRYRRSERYQTAKRNRLQDRHAEARSGGDEPSLQLRLG